MATAVAPDLRQHSGCPARARGWWGGAPAPPFCKATGRRTMRVVFRLPSALSWSRAARPRRSAGALEL